MSRNTVSPATVHPSSNAGKDVAKDTPEEDIKLTKTFASYMDDNAALETMIQKGKGKLKWERDMPKEIEEKLEV